MIIWNVTNSVLIPFSGGEIVGDPLNWTVTCVSTHKNKTKYSLLHNLSHVSHMVLFGRWRTHKSCRTDLLCTWRTNGKLSVSLRQPIGCTCGWTRDSLLNFRLKISLAQLTDKWWFYYISRTIDIVMFYGLQNLDHEFRYTYVQFIVIVPGVRSSLPGINTIERTEHVIVKSC